MDRRGPRRGGLGGVERNSSARPRVEWVRQRRQRASHDVDAVLDVCRPRHVPCASPRPGLWCVERGTSHGEVRLHARWIPNQALRQHSPERVAPHVTQRQRRGPRKPHGRGRNRHREVVSCLAWGRRAPRSVVEELERKPCHPGLGPSHGGWMACVPRRTWGGCDEDIAEGCCDGKTREEHAVVIRCLLCKRLRGRCRYTVGTSVAR